MRIHPGLQLIQDLLGPGLDLVLEFSGIFFEMLELFLHLFQVQVHMGHQLSFHLHDQRFIDRSVAVDYGLDLFGVDVLPVGTQDHVLGAAPDVKDPFPVHIPQVSGVQVAVFAENLRGQVVFPVISLHDIGPVNHDLSFAGCRVGIFDPDRHIVHNPPHGAVNRILRSESGHHGRSLGKAVADGVRESPFDKELFHIGRQRCPAHAEEAYSSPEELHQFAGSCPVKQPSCHPCLQQGTGNG